MIDFTVEIEGLASLNAALVELGRKAPQALRPAINKAVTPLVRAVKAATPVGPTKNLKRSITRKVYTSQRTKTIIGLAGARRAGKGVKAPHEHLVRFGTKPRYRKQKSTGKPGYTGIMPANDYPTRILAGMRSQLEAIVVKEAMANVEKIAAREAAKKARRQRLA